MCVKNSRTQRYIIMWENMFCFCNINKYMNNTFRLMDDLTGNITLTYVRCSKLNELTRHKKSEGEGHTFFFF